MWTRHKVWGVFKPMESWKKLASILSQTIHFKKYIWELEPLRRRWRLLKRQKRKILADPNKHSAYSNSRSFYWKCVIYYMLPPLSGVYSAAHDLNVEWIIIKGVSDFADGTKSETNAWRPFASLMAASFVAHILSNPITFEELPHYNSGKTNLPPS